MLLFFKVVIAITTFCYLNFFSFVSIAKVYSLGNSSFILVTCYSYSRDSKAFIVAEIAQLGERQTEDLKVPGSNPENSHEF